MTRHIFRDPRFALIIALLLTGVLAAPVLAQDSDTQGKIEVSTPSGNLHIGKDADAKQTGLPLYPGARPKSSGDDKENANLSLLTDAFGIKLIVAKYVSDDAPGQVADFYRGKLKKYGKVLECHSSKHADGAEVYADDKDSNKSNELKCDEDSGPVTELKVGTDDNQRIVAVEPGDGGKGSNLCLVYVYTRGKRGDI
jgi:hypothetical protein